MRKAAIYLRVSTTGQSTDNQRLELERIAERRGWSVVEVYEDFGHRESDSGVARSASPLSSAFASSWRPAQAFSKRRRRSVSAPERSIG